MAQKFNRSALFFGQLAQPEPPQPKLSDFYKNVGEGQVGAVQQVGAGVQAETAKLPSQFGITYGEKGPEMAAGSPFKPTVDIKTSTVAAPTGTEFKTSEEAGAVAQQAGKNIQQLAAEKTAAETALGSSTEQALSKAGEASKAAQDKLTEGKLGQRTETPSELEKAAQNYRSILQSGPGTSNVAAVANLMRFYDPATGAGQYGYDRKYLPLEAGLRQGETALARQQAGTTEAALQQAESVRAGAVQDYKDTADRAYSDVKDKIAAEKKSKLDDIEKYYSKLSEAETGTKGIAEGKQADLAKVEQENAVKEVSAAATNIKDNPTVAGIENVLNAVSGRSGDNWLNTRGNEVLRPIKGEIAGLINAANRVQNDPNLPLKERKAQLEDINNQINGYRGKIAGELAAFLGDTNTRPGDALDAAEQIISGGFMGDLSDKQKDVIRRRIEQDMHVTVRDKNTRSDAAKLVRIYKAFGGTNPDFEKNAETKEMRDLIGNVSFTAPVGFGGGSI